MTPPHSEKSTFGRDLILLLGAPLIAVVGLLAWWKPWVPRIYSAATPGQVFELAAGTWDWSDAERRCIENPHSLSFSPDHKAMYFADRKGWKDDSTGRMRHTAIYDIQEFTPSRIRGLIRGETRKTDDGVPVVWDLIMTTRDSYAWHRTDWRTGGRTKEVRRCPVSTKPVEFMVEGDSVVSVMVDSAISGTP